MVYQSVTDGCFVDDSMFGVENVETMVRAMTIPAIKKIVVKQEDVVLQVSLELLHVLPRPLPTSKLLPGSENIL
ncbi:hypothetical protein HY631_01090 [Candidatus Uhrbacteria bacterium]|nr:hypothetical protein [Candidatus Uhrbacteria bacterium]